MKKLILLLSLLIATPALACDRIAGLYATAKTVDFCLYITDATVGAIKVENSVHASGDTYVMKDEGAEANTTNAFVDEGSCYSIVLTSTEMTAARVTLNIEDQSTKTWADKCVVIETYGNASAEHTFPVVTIKDGTGTGEIDTNAGAVVAVTTTTTATTATTCTNLTNLPTIPTDWITAAGVATSAIGAAELAADAIGASEIAADALTTAEIATGAISSDEIADNAIDAGALATDTITAAKIAADSIAASEIATDAIGASEIAADAIASSELATTAVTEIVNGVWDELKAGHAVADSFGDFLDDEVSAAVAGGGGSSSGVSHDP